MPDPALAKLRIACPECGKPMLPRTNRENGSEFLGCSQWPKCTATQPLPAYVAMLRQGAPTLPGFD
jgi:ssDNA-binding Zn-finger/Zn-ribbon topoisomerase 1